MIYHFIIAVLLHSTFSYPPLSECVWYLSSPTFLDNILQYSTYGRCSLIISVQSPQEITGLLMDKHWVRSLNMRINCHSVEGKCVLLKNQKKIYGRLIWKKNSEYRMEMQNGETFHIITKKNDLVEFNCYLWKCVTEMMAVLTLLLFGYSIYQYHPKLVLLGIHFYFLLTMTTIRVILGTVGQVLSWKLFKIIPYMLLLLICIIKILQYLEKHLSEVEQLSSELRIMGITLIMMVTSWNEIISLIYFIFIVNGILSQFKENEDEIVKLKSPFKKLVVYYFFILFNLLLANQYQFDHHLFVQFNIIFFLMITNVAYLFFMYARKLPKIYHIRIVKTKKKEECPICLQNIEQKEGAQTGCGHIFHAECLSSWIKNKSTCPIDRNLLNISIIK